MSPRLRPAHEADFPAVAALYGREVLEGTATFEETPPSVEDMLARWRAVQDKGLPWLVAEVDGAFAGYAYLSPFRPRAAYRYAVEVSIYVAADAQGRGVGRALLQALIDHARVAGLRHLIGAISQSASSDASIGLHRALGFELAGVYRQVGWKFGRWLDVTLMQLDLNPAGAAPASEGLTL
ncbi:GNAT family N-acetyltransferase [Brevundimonas sp. 2R-24]|uniref:GNAT family N-acetyltransferase n=1 Tax=Peiella sedimenti TaxID=3061083 RepID=A0ABT8SIN7_9CAUL|nr:GNAT family N-acetyltransferase [Caulobacteraceae bacterium XZ-24]